MISSKRAESTNPDDLEEESTVHEWAEYNIPPGLAPPGAADDDDRFAFLRFGMEQDGDLPEGIS